MSWFSKKQFPNLEKIIPDQNIWINSLCNIPDQFIADFIREFILQKNNTKMVLGKKLIEECFPKEFWTNKSKYKDKDIPFLPEAIEKMQHHFSSSLQVLLTKLSEGENITEDEIERIYCESGLLTSPAKQEFEHFRHTFQEWTPQELVMRIKMDTPMTEMDEKHPNLPHFIPYILEQIEKMENTQAHQFRDKYSIDVGDNYHILL
jgi:hypothetical protein